MQRIHRIHKLLTSTRHDRPLLLRMSRLQRPLQHDLRRALAAGRNRVPHERAVADQQSEHERDDQERGGRRAAAAAAATATATAQGPRTGGAALSAVGVGVALHGVAAGALAPVGKAVEPVAHRGRRALDPLAPVVVGLERAVVLAAVERARGGRRARRQRLQRLQRRLGGGRVGAVGDGRASVQPLSRHGPPGRVSAGPAPAPVPVAAARRAFCSSGVGEPRHGHTGSRSRSTWHSAQTPTKSWKASAAAGGMSAEWQWSWCACTSWKASKHALPSEAHCGTPPTIRSHAPLRSVAAAASIASSL